MEAADDFVPAILNLGDDDEEDIGFFDSLISKCFWIIQNAREYSTDLFRLVPTGV